MTSVADPSRHPAVDVTAVPALASRLDLAIAAGLGIWAVAEVVAGSGLGPGGLAFALGATAPLALRRRFPAGALAVVAASTLIWVYAGQGAPTATPFPSLLVLAFTVAAQVRSTPYAVALGLVPVATMYAATVLGYFGAEGQDLRSLAILLFFVGGAWGGGRLVRSRAQAAIAAEQRVDASAAAAVAAERARIAHELHDVVAHAVSVVVLQTGAAEQLLDRSPERARRHIADARRTAAGAMAEMRRLLDVLQDTTGGYRPQPGLQDLPALVEETRNAGHPVELVLTDPDGTVGEGPALAAFRVVQEALTNVRKHAPGAPVRVEVHVRPALLSVEVVNEAATDAPSSTLDGGAGLVGMRERVRVYGGQLQTGATANGGWRVRAELPLAPESGELR